MSSTWDILSDDLQLTLSAEALRRAVAILADQADLLASAMDDGELQDRGGPDALRLFAAIARTGAEGPGHPAGSA